MKTLRGVGRTTLTEEEVEVFAAEVERLSHEASHEVFQEMKGQIIGAKAKYDTREDYVTADEVPTLPLPLLPRLGNLAPLSDEFTGKKWIFGVPTKPLPTNDRDRYADGVACEYTTLGLAPDYPYVWNDGVFTGGVCGPDPAEVE